MFIETTAHWSARASLLLDQRIAGPMTCRASKWPAGSGFRSVQNEGMVLCSGAFSLVTSLFAPAKRK
jgi:hypothetical protein